METTDGNNNKSFSNLTNIYISRANYSANLENADIGLLALSFLRSGLYHYSNGALNDRNSNGRYWSLHGNSGTHVYGLGFGSTYIDPQYGGYRGRGLSLRCLAR